MERIINIPYPEFFAQTLRLNDEDFERETKMSSIIKLYELGKISSGIAAKILEISRIDFLDKLSAYKISTIGIMDTDDLKNEIENA